MKKLNLVSLGMIFSLFVAQESYGSSRSLTYDDVREEGGFNASSLKNVMQISQGGRNLARDEITALVKSTSLVGLKILDLTNQSAIDDNTIDELSKNSTFSRLISLKLSGTSITNESITFILNSRFLGSVVDLPQMSGRYGRPSSVVKVYTKDTDVTDTGQCETFNFHIEYSPPNPNVYWEPVDHGVKIVEVESW